MGSYTSIRLKLHSYTTIYIRIPSYTFIYRHMGSYTSVRLHIPPPYSFIHTSYAMLLSGIPWNMPCVTCIFRIHTSPCLNLRKTYGNFGKSAEISANFRKLRKRFKPIFVELKQFMKLLKNFGNSSKVFPDVFMIF